jgi:hypothetical protein
MNALTSGTPTMVPPREQRPGFVNGSAVTEDTEAQKTKAACQNSFFTA